MIRAEGVTRIFGPDPDRSLPLLAQGRSKDEIQAETSQVVGVHDASFELAPGEVFVIMGLSGSGKSTLIRCINRLVDPTAGRVFIADEDGSEREITAMDAEALRRMRRSDMSMVFQHFALFPHRTVLANAVYGLEIQGRPREEREHIGGEVLEMVGLGGWGDAWPSELSGGMQQRVGLARALATRARVLLMDEPFSALDPLIKVNMQRELMKIQQDLHRTILFITHDLDEAMRIGDRIAIMEAGQIVQIGSPEQILVNPRTEYVANFVEHADPTGVITAGTVALPFDETCFEGSGTEAGLDWYRTRNGAGPSIGIDGDRRPRRVQIEGSDVDVADLDSVIDGEGRGEGERLVLACSEDTVLRRILRGRIHSRLPVIVVDEDGRLRGLIDERELIRGIVDKRGYEADAATGQGEGA